MEHPEAVNTEIPEKTESYENLKISAKAERNKPKKPPTNPYTFENFKKPSTFVLYLIGIILWPKESYRFHKWCLVNYFIAILAISIDIACEVYNQASETTLLGITKYCAYIIYTVLGEVKILFIFSNLSQINKLLKTLNSIFPVTKKELAAYNIEEYRQKTILLTLPPVLCVVANVMFNTGSSLYRYFFIIDRTKGKDMGHILQYYPTYPFKIDTFWLYFAANLQQFHSALMVLLGVTGSEALLTFIVLQVCMHLNALSIRLDKRHCDRGDIKDLNIVVARHSLLLRLVEDINNTFKVTTFITFLTSAFSICFGGFQIMYASDPVVFGNFIFFILYDMLKLYVTSILGDMLIQLFVFESLKKILARKPYIMEHPEAVNTEIPEETENYENLKMSAKAERNKPKKPPTNPYAFENFKKPPTFVLYLIGIILWPKESYRAQKWCLVNFCIAILAINIDIACEVYNQVSETTLLGITKYCAYITYTVLGEVKILFIFSNLSQINQVLKTLNSIFPVTKKQLAAYNIEEYRQKTVLLTLTPVLCVVANVMFNTGSSLYRYFFIIDRTYGKDMGHILQYYPTYPFKIDTFWLYFAANLQQFHSALMVLLGVTGSQALLTFIVLQVCMHLNALSIRLDKRHCERGDINDLKIIVARHSLILRLMEDINNTFKVTTFITFLTSAFSICFGGFEIMYASDPVVFGNFFFLILYDTIQLYIASLLGDMLIQLSFEVGDSAYNTKWYENTIQYQKVIQLIINRSQKPANLNAITFHGACLVTFKEVCSKSYTFFTVLHTMYKG